MHFYNQKEFSAGTCVLKKNQKILIRINKHGNDYNRSKIWSEWLWQETQKASDLDSVFNE